MKYLNENNFWYLSNGLTYNRSDLKVLDDTLFEFNNQTGIIDRIIKENKLHGFSHNVKLSGGQFIFSLDKYLTSDGKRLTTVHLMQMNSDKQPHPCIHLNLQSPSLMVPQRIEIPLKYILHGLPSLEGTHMVYLHAISLNNGNTFSYYGRTKRGWMKRFLEHLRLAMKGSNRKFPDLFGTAIKARYDELGGNGLLNNQAAYSGSYHVVCSAGLDKQTAIDTERYLIGKIGLSPNSGLNMI